MLKLFSPNSNGLDSPLIINEKLSFIFCMVKLNEQKYSWNCDTIQANDPSSKSLEPRPYTLASTGADPAICSNSQRPSFHPLCRPDFEKHYCESGLMVYLFTDQQKGGTAESAFKNDSPLGTKSVSSVLSSSFSYRFSFSSLFKFYSVSLTSTLLQPGGKLWIF